MTKLVRAGQLYRSKARRGYRYVRIARVFVNPPSVSAYEVRKDGSKVRGRYPLGHVLAGMDRSARFTIYLTYDGDKLRMPGGYEPVEPLPKTRRGTVEGGCLKTKLLSPGSPGATSTESTSPTKARRGRSTKSPGSSPARAVPPVPSSEKGSSNG